MMQKIARLAPTPSIGVPKVGGKVGARMMRPAGRHPHLRMPGNRMPSKGAGMPNQNDMTMESLLGMMGGPKT